MLYRSLREQSVGALLGGQAMAAKLEAYLTSVIPAAKLESVASRSLLVECREAICQDIELRAPARHRNELEEIAGQVCTGTFLSGPDLPVLQAIVGDLLDASSNPICFKPIHVQAFACLAAEIDPAVIVAWHLAERSHGRSRVEHREFRQRIIEQLPLAVPIGPFDSKMAENHAHLWGVLSDGTVLAQLVLDPSSESLSLAFSANADPDEQGLQLRLHRIRRMLRAFVTLWRSELGDGALKSEEGQRLLAKASVQHLSEALSAASLEWSNELAALGTVNSGNVSARSVLNELAAAIVACDLQRAWLWLFAALWRTYRCKTATSIVRAAVLLTMCDLMLLRRRLIMEGHGLRRFARRYYNGAMQSYARKSVKWSNAVYQDLGTRLFARVDDVAELKISAGSFNPGFTAAFAKAVTGTSVSTSTHGLLPPFQSASAEDALKSLRDSLDRWHFCAHFNRSGDDSTAARRRTLWQEAEAFRDSLSRTSGWQLSDLIGNAATHSRNFHPARFIRGLDVAGDETRWPIEVYAPILRWLREPLVKSGLVAMPAPRVDPLHFSIHAGEDYAHPLSGMRHVDETVQFCDMGEGDRLGHALALGLPPDKWCQRRREMLLPVDEHVDNLVWAWKIASTIEAKLPELSQFCKRLEARIARFLPYVTWCGPTDSQFLPSGRDLFEPLVGPMPTNDVLYEAWMLRKNCPILFHQQEKSSFSTDRSKLHTAVPDLDRLNIAKKSPATDPAVDLFLKRAQTERIARGPQAVTVQLTPQPNGVAARRQLHLEEQRPDARGVLHDHDSHLDLTGMIALQDYLIETYAIRGLSIETNPTSNVYVAGLETYDEHPIFRWDPPNATHLADKGMHNRFGLRRRPMPVTINTDDQGLLPTTLRFEYHLMRESALDQAVSENHVDSWIATIRQRGIDHFERNHRPIAG